MRSTVRPNTFTARQVPKWICRSAVAMTVCTALACGVSGTFAQSSVVGPAAETPAASSTTSIIVLQNGKVFEGEVTPVAGGYRIRQPIGTSMIPFETVLLTAPNLKAAYAKLSANQRQPTYGTHLQIARWCADNGLFDEARREIASAIRLEPNRRPARELLKQIELKTSSTPQHLTTPAPIARTADGFEAAEAVSAARISPALTQDFIRRVQPLMVNTCGNASCHGPSSGNAFTIDIVRSGRRNQRVHSERNLAATLQQIDAARPELSPLLRRPAGLADTAHRTVFTGPRGNEQLAMLRNWVHGVTGATEQIATTTAPRPSPADAPTADMTASGITPASYNASNIDPVTGQPGSGGTNDDALLDRVLVEERADAFDPDIFNRNVHGYSVFASPEQTDRKAADR
ncbi:hypothetical protein Mal4_49110 [Maioricimonas rarisocia]|uniref:Tetratricopeptide repeat protein n=1 Tax=Maioricimonas rarisocia TaxID=2528026 RepID=A0A517ZDI6_9PLAN|nr:hypothetical protein [Maioricimonas rarisocia]QDU40553.1 hypothetical protein Mal4_49110 [Maioricimonas rarisocia]